METNQMGSEFSFSLVVIVAILFCMPFVTIAATDYFQVNNAKDSVDKEVKRAITTCMVNQVEDNRSSNRKISIDQSALEEKIKEMAEKNVMEKFGMAFVIDDITVVFNEKYYVTYKGHVTYSPMFFKGNEQVTIPVTGRSKIQRFDKE